MCDVWKELERHFRNMLPSLTFCKNDFRQQPNLEKKTVKSFKHFLQKISAESQKQMCSHRRFFLAGHGLSKCNAIMKCGKCKDDCHPMALHNRETWHDMNGRLPMKSHLTISRWMSRSEVRDAPGTYLTLGCIIPGSQIRSMWCSICHPSSKGSH